MAKSQNDFRPGIDIKGYHGQVAAPGSTIDGKPYTWQQGPDVAVFKDAPAQLLKLCQRQPRERNPATPYIANGFEPDTDEVAAFVERWSHEAPEAVQGAGGREVTKQVLLQRGDLGLTAPLAVEVLNRPDGWNETKASPPWDPGELEELALGMEAVRENPIGYKHPTAQFDVVMELEATVKANGHDKSAESGLLPPCIDMSAWGTRQVPSLDWVIENRIQNQSVALLTGDGGVGKTVLALDLAIATILGMGEWLGAKFLKSGPAMMLCCEDDARVFERRTVAIASIRKTAVSAIQSLHLITLAGKTETILALPDHNGVMRPTQLYHDLMKRAKKVKPIIIIIDNAADVFGGDEINRRQVRQFISLLRALAVECDTAVVLNAHPSLSGMASGRGTSGSTHWHNSVRQRFYMREADAHENPLKIEGLRIVEIMKNNYGPGKGILDPFRWEAGVLVPVDMNATEQAKRPFEAAEALFMNFWISSRR